jgi:5-methylcytosine-specific restriction endonuclease McrA
MYRGWQKISHPTKTRRVNVCKSLRQATWLKYCGPVFESACSCCYTAKMTVFNFHCAHIRAVARGGGTTISNLKPTCPTCNLSMGTEEFKSFQRKMGYKRSFWNFYKA